MNDDQDTRLREHLKSSSKSDLRAYCGELIAAGVEHKEIMRAIMSSVSGHAVADESWLPTTSIINMSDSLVHVPLQLDENKHLMMAFGERHPKFRRIEAPPRLSGSVDQLRERFEQATLGNDWQLGERCLLGIAEEADLDTVFSTLLETLLKPRYLGKTSGPWWAGVRHLLIGGMIDLRNEFGDEALLHAVCNRGAKQCAIEIGEHSDRTQHAMRELEVAYTELEESDFGRSRTGNSSGDSSDPNSCESGYIPAMLDEPSFRIQVSSGRRHESIRRRHFGVANRSSRRSNRPRFDDVVRRTHPPRRLRQRRQLGQPQAGTSGHRGHSSSRNDRQTVGVQGGPACSVADCSSR